MRLSMHVCGLVNHDLGEEHRPTRDLPTMNSLLRTIRLWYILPAVLHSPANAIHSTYLHVYYWYLFDYQTPPFDPKICALFDRLGWLRCSAVNLFGTDQRWNNDPPPKL